MTCVNYEPQSQKDRPTPIDDVNFALSGLVALRLERVYVRRRWAVPNDIQARRILLSQNLNGYLVSASDFTSVYNNTRTIAIGSC